MENIFQLFFRKEDKEFLDNIKTREAISAKALERFLEQQEVDGVYALMSAYSPSVVLNSLKSIVSGARFQRARELAAGQIPSTVEAIIKETLAKLKKDKTATRGEIDKLQGILTEVVGSLLEKGITADLILDVIGSAGKAENEADRLVSTNEYKKIKYTKARDEFIRVDSQVRSEVVPAKKADLEKKKKDLNDQIIANA
ncbi:MAG: hypothetical protein HYY52_06895 [Candidatus Melainabacteria bacterium]|nr:hypothetical protein [Candidatus Melainabacteria bacterium]